MKGFTTLILSIFFALGCTDESASGKLEGTWEVRSVYGGLLPGNTYRPGEGPVVTFTGFEYLRHLDDSLIAQGTYSTRVDTFFDGKRKMPRLILDGDDSEQNKTFFEVSESSLRIYSGAPVELDGTVSILERR